MRSIWTYLILGFVVLAGLVLRTWNVNFDGGLNAHPDERSNTCFFAPTLGWPSSFDEFLDPELSPLNPLKYRRATSVPMLTVTSLSIWASSPANC